MGGKRPLAPVESPDATPPGPCRRPTGQVVGEVVLSQEQSLVGRDEELAAIRSRVRLAAAGQPGVVWIEGEAGAGKTALLRAALQELPGGCILTRAETDELSMDLPFELIHQLGAEVTTSAFPTGLSLLQRWGQQQDDGLVVVAVEDLHWADPQS